tara:strand:+ start:765 stop:1163 length:399 start_codon:yes stop_codon:yes gene_type:complete
MKKLLLLIGILILTLGCSSEPEIIYRDVEVVVTATPPPFPTTTPTLTAYQAKLLTAQRMLRKGCWGDTRSRSYEKSVIEQLLAEYQGKRLDGGDLYDIEETWVVRWHPDSRSFWVVYDRTRKIEFIGSEDDC